MIVSVCIYYFMPTPSATISNEYQTVIYNSTKTGLQEKQIHLIKQHSNTSQSNTFTCETNPKYKVSFFNINRSFKMTTIDTLLYFSIIQMSEPLVQMVLTFVLWKNIMMGYLLQYKMLNKM